MPRSYLIGRIITAVAVLAALGLALGVAIPTIVVPLVRTANVDLQRLSTP